MSSVPFDSTLAFLREGYAFVSSRCDALNSDIFTSRIALRPVTFIRGAEAANMFYEGDRFTRAGAMPPTVQHLLQDKGSVQGLDGAEHQHRKQAFMSLMGSDAMTRLGDLFEHHWDEVIQRLAVHRQFNLHDTVQEILTRTACSWAGIEIAETHIPRLTKELSLMVDEAGRFGPANWYAQWRRRGTERWAAGLIDDVRSGALHPPEGTALEVFAHYTTPDGQRLSSQLAAVELINILRPTVAVSRFIAFAAVALEEHPEWAQAFAADDETDLEPFVQEIRRYYPFFPVIAGRVNEPFTCHGHRFKAQDWVVLDIYGTCHDGRLWQDPESFQPERFRGWDWEEDLSALIAQGAGHHRNNHRCPGEWSTIELLKRAIRKLAKSDFTMPVQDTSIPLHQMPALPRSGVIVSRTGH